MGKINSSVAAFTIIELIMVIVLAAILAAIGFASLSPTQAIRSTHAALKIQTDIRYAQSLAISTQKRTRIFFDVGTSSYTVEIEQTYDANDWTAAKDPHTRKNFIVQLNTESLVGIGITEVFFNADNLYLLFDKWGKPYSFDNATLTATALTANGYVSINGPKSIWVTKTTGKVYVTDS